MSVNGGEVEKEREKQGNRRGVKPIYMSNKVPGKIRYRRLFWVMDKGKSYHIRRRDSRILLKKGPRSTEWGY